MSWLVAVPVGPASAAGGEAGACPAPGAVWDQVAALIGRDRLPQISAPGDLVVDDRGERYRIAFRGRGREYADPARDCVGRAQVAAVFVALTLVPPEFLLTPRPPARLPLPAPPPAPSPLPAAGNGLVVQIEGGPWAGAVLRSGGEGTTAGLGFLIRAIGGGAHLAAIAGFGAMLPTTGSVVGRRVTEQRTAVDLGTRLRWRRRVLEAGLDVEGVVAALRVSSPGTGLATMVADGGIRVGAILGFGDRRLVPLVGVFADMSLTPRRLSLVPDGEVGQMSRIRLGALAGVGWRFR